MKTRVQQWGALGLSAALLGALSILTSGGLASSAGATAPSLTASPTNLALGEATLGTYVGPSSFTMNNTSSAAITVTFSFSGAGADDYAWTFGQGCGNPSDASGEVISMPATTSCTVDIYFYPGALGERDATLNLNSVDLNIPISLSGTGGIGYYQVTSDGQIGYAGDAGFYGDMSNTTLNQPIVGMAQTGDDGGYWLVASDGGIFNFGDAPFYGSTGGIALNKPIVGMAGSYNSNGPSGYWLVASDGGIFSYGSAQFYGSTGSIHLNKPIVGMAATPDGDGYWLVASDGGIFSYGDAQFYGSTGSIHLNKPIVGMAPTPDGNGYWLVASDGGIFSYGDAQVLRVHRCALARPAHRGHGRHARRWRLLVQRRRRRALQLRVCTVLRERGGAGHRPGRGHGHRRRPDRPGTGRSAGATPSPEGCGRFRRCPLLRQLLIRHGPRVVAHPGTGPRGSEPGGGDDGTVQMGPGHASVVGCVPEAVDRAQGRGDPVPGTVRRAEDGRGRVEEVEVARRR